WREAVLERFKMRHSRYGDLQGHFDGTGWEFFKKGIWLWLSIPVLFVVAVTVVGIIAAGAQNQAMATIALYLIFGIVTPFVYAGFKAIQWRWWISGIRFGEVSFSSTIRARNLFGLYWKVAGWCL